VQRLFLDVFPSCLFLMKAASGAPPGSKQQDEEMEESMHRRQATMTDEKEILLQ
jgi:hypothetical protein